MSHDHKLWATSIEGDLMFPEIDGSTFTFGDHNQDRLNIKIQKAEATNVSESGITTWRNSSGIKDLSISDMIQMERQAASIPETRLTYNGFEIDGGHWKKLDDLNEYRATNNYPELSMDQYTGAILRGAHTDYALPFHIKGSHPELAMETTEKMFHSQPYKYFGEIREGNRQFAEHDPTKGHTNVMEGSFLFSHKNNLGDVGYWKQGFAEKYKEAGYEVVYQTHAEDKSWTSEGGIYFPADVNTEGDIYDNVVALIEHEKNGLWTAPEELFQQGSGGRQARGPYKHLINQEIANVELPADYIPLDEAMSPAEKPEDYVHLDGLWL